MVNTLVKLDIATKQKLDSIKVHHRETYNDVVERLIKQSGLCQ